MRLAKKDVTLQDGCLTGVGADLYRMFFCPWWRLAIWWRWFHTPVWARKEGRMTVTLKNGETLSVKVLMFKEPYSYPLHWVAKDIQEYPTTPKKDGE